MQFSSLALFSKMFGLFILTGTYIKIVNSIIFERGNTDQTHCTCTDLLRF